MLLWNALWASDSTSYVYKEKVKLEAYGQASYENNLKEFKKYRKSTSDVFRKGQGQKDMGVFYDGFMVKGPQKISTHITGAIVFRAMVHFEDDGFSYQIDNVSFQPYKRNRYGKFVPKPGKYIPLGKIANSTYSDVEIEAYNKAAREYIEGYIIDLKGYMAHGK